VTLAPDTLIIRGGMMPGQAVLANIQAVFDRYGRNGMCLKVLIDHDVDIRGDRLVPHPRMCLTTPRLLEESGLVADVDPTNDLGDHYQYTLWLPEGDPAILVDQVRIAFRGPFLKAEVSDEWTTDDLRGLQCPGS
jgi:hypothetical protein